MAATIAELMAGLKVRLATVSGLEAYDYAPDDPVPPCAFPLVPPIPSYRDTMQRGRYVLTFRVVVLTGAQLDREGQMRLAEFASQTGSSSIRTAIEGDRTLDGLAEECVVDSFTPDGLEEVGLVNYYGGTFLVRVVARGNT